MEGVPLPDERAGSYGAFTDWLNCTFSFEKSKHRKHVFFGTLFELLGPKFGPAIDRQRGFHGWTESFSLGETGAIFACGGQNGTGLLSLSGEACSLITEWSRFAEVMQDAFAARITRWDGAVDDYLGEHSVDMALSLYMGDQFGSGGRRPTQNQHGAWAAPDGSGRTLEVGKRENGKMLRVYEKGAQLGARWHPWVRWELELHRRDRVIPWAVLTEPGRYVVGAYPKALAWIQKDACRIESIRRAEQVSYEHLMDCASTQYGKLLNVAAEVEGSAAKAFERLRQAGSPKRLMHPLIDKPSEWLE